jgi:SAM-dependent methyltransferase
VPEVAATLAEIRRVLRPDGRLLVLEHVRSVDPRLARWQDRWEHPWRLLGAGCECNRDIAGAIEAGGFSLEWSLAGAMPKAPPIVRRLISAVARPVPVPAGGRGLVDAGSRSLKIRDVNIVGDRNRSLESRRLLDRRAVAGLCSFSGHRDLRGRW